MKVPPCPCDAIDPAGPNPKMIIGMTIPNFVLWVSFNLALIVIIGIAFLTS